MIFYALNLVQSLLLTTSGLALLVVMLQAMPVQHWLMPDGARWYLSVLHVLLNVVDVLLNVISNRCQGPYHSTQEINMGTLPQQQVP